MNKHQSLFDWAERLFVLISLLFMIGALRPLYANLSPAWGFDHTAGNATFQGISMAIYLVSGMILLLYYRRALYFLLKNKCLVIFVLLTVVSASWAVAPDLSIRRSLALTGTTVFAFYLAAKFRPGELLEMLGWAFILVVVANLFMVTLMPHIGVSSYPHAGAWRGIFGHKNEMGRIILLGALVFWIISIRSETERPWIFAGVVLCLVMLAFSQSRTAWVVLALLLISIPLLQFLRRPEFPLILRSIVICVGVAGIAIVLFTYLDEILSLLERDETLTDRTYIWAAGVEVGVHRPWFGYGYRSFWLGGDGLTRFEHGHGHNSFLDLWLELGVVGLTLFLFTLAILAYRTFWRLVSSHDALGLFYMIFLIYTILFSMTSQVIPQQGTITWVLYVTVTLYLTSVPREVRAPAHSRMIATHEWKI